MTPDWIIDMQKHYNETGCYKPQHIRQLLGNTKDGVSNYQLPPQPTYTPHLNQGWQCPACKNVYSPTTSACWKCNGPIEVTC